MLARYGLKALEYLLYALAALAAFELFRIQSEDRESAITLAGVIFILIGLGVLVPRIVAYWKWPRVAATVGGHRATWDGEKSAAFSYDFGDQRFSGRLRSIYGSARPTRLHVCVNPRAPAVRYLVWWTVWCVGLVLLCLGIFVLTTGMHPFGWPG